MSDESHRRDRRSRPLSNQEKAVILALLESKSDNLSKRLDGAEVEDMADGGMGSIHFVLPDAQEAPKFGKTLVEAEYLDSDGILVEIALSVDQDGELFEVDFWKVDFSKLRTYPSPAQLRAKKA